MNLSGFEYFQEKRIKHGVFLTVQKKVISFFSQSLIRSLQDDPETFGDFAFIEDYDFFCAINWDSQSGRADVCVRDRLKLELFVRK